MRLALWSPRPDEGWVAALVPLLARECSLALAGGEPASLPEADLDLFHMADDPAHGFIYRALQTRPGLVVLETWSLHRLVRSETAGRGDDDAYRHEARRAHGDAGAFVARQVLGGLGGELLPALFPLNDRVLEGSLGLVATTEYVRRRAAGRRTRCAVLHLPLHLEGLVPLPPRAEARAGLGLSGAGPVLAALRPTGGVTRERTRHALERLGAEVVWTDEGDPRQAQRLAAADVLVALESPPRGGVPTVVASALAAGRPTLVSAGSAAALEFPVGVVVPVSPGPTEDAEVEALGRRLLEDRSLRDRVGAVASEYVRQRTDPARAAGALLAMAREVLAHKKEALGATAAARAAEGTPTAWAMEEVRWGARDLGLSGLDLGLERLVGDLLRAGS